MSSSSSSGSSSSSSSESQDTHDSSGRKKCADCSYKDQQVEQLQQKLEHALHMNKLMVGECQRLNNVIEEMKWRNGNRRQNPPTLPNEIWHAIFSLATKSKGPAFSNGHGYSEDTHRKESLKTRLSIPLVCRQWATVGTEFLYHCLVFYRSEQLDWIEETFFIHPIYKNWCYDVELLLVHADQFEAADYYNKARILLQSLHRIQSLVINSTGYAKKKNIQQLLEDVQSKLQILHIDLTKFDGHKALFREEPVEIATDIGALMPWKHLETLSLIPGHWGIAVFEDKVFEELSRVHFPSLRKLYFAWPESWSDILFRFLQQHPLLTEIYISSGFSQSTSTVFMCQLEKVLHSLPRLMAVSIANWPQSLQEIPDDPYTHDHLESIVIYKVSWYRKIDITSVWSVFKKLERGELPNCKVIEFRGDFIDGCIDSNFFITPRAADRWRDAIQLCKRHDVALVNEMGQKLHLWKDRNGIHYNKRGEICNLDSETADETSSSDDDWEEESGERPLTPEWESTSEEELDDPDDSPYIYRSRPDIQPVEDESDIDSESDSS